MISKNSIACKYDGFIFDLDGTIYLENKLIDKADEVINKIHNNNKNIVFVSNKTTGSIKDYCEFLNSQKLNIQQKQIITSTTIIKKYLSENYYSKNFYAIAENKFIDEIISSGLAFKEDPSIVDIVIITLDRTLTYSKLEIAARSLDRGAQFFAANIDNTCPVESGEIMDAGSTISALEKRTGRTLQKYFGKPSKMILQAALSVINTDAKNSLIVGDRLETDIAMGNKFGIDTALVNTGVAKDPINYSNYKPTFRLNSIYDLIL